MEFVKVTTSDDKRVNVKIDGEVNGMTGDVLSVSEGWMNISVDATGYQDIMVDVSSTTSRSPMEVVVEKCS